MGALDFPEVPDVSLAFLAILLSTTVQAPTGQRAGPTFERESLFVDDAGASGVRFRHMEGSATFGIGGGAAWIDHDGDGDGDLFCVDSAGRHVLFENDGGSFTNVTAGSGLPSPLPIGMGVSVADFDQDGRADLYITNRGPNRLLHNQGDGTFVDVGGLVGVADASWSVSASWADFDLDGDLDLYVGNYIQGISFPYHIGAPNRLYLSSTNSPLPSFLDEALALGVDDSGVFEPLHDPSLAILVNGVLPPVGNPTAGCTLSVSTLDADEDGDADLFVGNDFGDWVRSDRHWRNDVVRSGSLAFTDVSATSGFGERIYNMGVNPADFDADGDWDFYLSNLGENSLLRQDEGVFTDRAFELGPLERADETSGLLLTTWGTSWLDADNDGWLDLFVANGYIPAAPFIATEPASSDHLWRNRANGTFQRVAQGLSGVADRAASRGVVSGDFDGDGRVDLFVVDSGLFGPTSLSTILWNRSESGGSVTLTLTGVRSNREGIGARAEAVVGTHRMKRQVLADPVYASSSSRALHFGLGAAAALDQLVIDWPAGTRQTLFALPAGTHAQVIEPDVVVTGIRPPTFAEQRWVVDVRLTNLAATPRTASLELVSTRTLPGGVRERTDQVDVPLAPGATQTTRFDLTDGPVPLGTLTLHATALHAGARDERRANFNAPTPPR